MLPKLKSDKNYHILYLGDRTLFFSYETLIAFNMGAKLYVSENVWSNTTGKHLNMVDDGDKSKRLKREEFEATYNRLNS